jgi:hypothetical protein
MTTRRIRTFPFAIRNFDAFEMTIDVPPPETSRTVLHVILLSQLVAHGRPSALPRLMTGMAWTGRRSALAGAWAGDRPCVLVCVPASTLGFAIGRTKHPLPRRADPRRMLRCNYEGSQHL